MTSTGIETADRAASSSLGREPLHGLLDRLHAEAKRDSWRFATLLPRIVGGFLRGKSFAEAVSPEAMKDFYIPVSREQGEFLYLTARAIGARSIVEFGTSFGISTLYLAAAVRDNGGGQVIGSEIEASKRDRALGNLREGGVEEWVDVRLGDAVKTLADVPDPVDLVLLDGWKDLYIPVLDLLLPRLRAGSVVLADNIYTFKSALRPYVERMQAPDGGFASTTLSLGDGFEYSVRL